MWASAHPLGAPTPWGSSFSKRIKAASDWSTPVSSLVNVCFQLFCFVLFLFWNRGSLCSLVWHGSHLNSQRSICLCLLSAGFKGVCHHTWLVCSLFIASLQPYRYVPKTWMLTARVLQELSSETQNKHFVLSLDRRKSLCNLDFRLCQEQRCWPGGELNRLGLQKHLSSFHSVARFMEMSECKHLL